MTYLVIAAVIGLLSVALFVFALKLLLNRRWLAGFVRGCSGLLLLAVTVVFSFSAYDLSSYSVAEPEKNLVTLSFRKGADNAFIVEFQEASGNFKSFPVSGEQWQLGARMFKWPPLLGAMGLKTGYRLESLRGRYLMLDMERKMAKEPERLSSSEYIDVWAFANTNPGVLGPLQAYTSTPGFIPIVDGAIFEVVLAGTNLAVRPLNEVAKSVMAGQ